MWVTQFFPSVSFSQGLQYIHRSDVQYHGKLRSSTCYLDNRWNVKLSGFGLHEFCAGEDRVENYPYENMYYAGKWMTLKSNTYPDNAVLIKYDLKNVALTAIIGIV